MSKYDDEDLKQVRKMAKHLKGHTVVEGDIPAEGAIVLEEIYKPVTTLSYEEVRRIYPLKISQEALERGTDLINQAILGVGDGLSEFLKENIVSWMGAIEGDRATSFQDYVNAIKFITFKQLGDTNVKAYSKVFVERVARIKADGLPIQYIHSYASAFSKSKIVTKIQAMMMIPVHLLYQDTFHRAIAVTAEIMEDTKVSPKVRVEAANNLMVHLRREEAKQAELTVKVDSNNILESFKESMAQIAYQQKELLEKKTVTLIDVSEMDIGQSNEAENS